jgi:hypothetical protein
VEQYPGLNTPDRRGKVAVLANNQQAGRRAREVVSTDVVQFLCAHCASVLTILCVRQSFEDVRHGGKRLPEERGSRKSEGRDINYLLSAKADCCFSRLPPLSFDEMQRQAHLDSLERRVGVLQRMADGHEGDCCCLLLPFAQV